LIELRNIPLQNDTEHNLPLCNFQSYWLGGIRWIGYVQGDFAKARDMYQHAVETGAEVSFLRSTCMPVWQKSPGNKKISQLPRRNLLKPKAITPISFPVSSMRFPLALPMTWKYYRGNNRLAKLFTRESSWRFAQEAQLRLADLSTRL